MESFQFQSFLSRERNTIGDLVLEIMFSAVSVEEEVNGLDEPVGFGVFKAKGLGEPVEISGLPSTGAMESSEEVAVLYLGLDVDFVADDLNCAFGESLSFAASVDFFKQVEECHFVITTNSEDVLTNRLDKEGSPGEIDRTHCGEIEFDPLLDVIF